MSATAVRLDDAVLADVAAAAASVDANTTPASAVLARLAEQGLLDTGLPQGDDTSRPSEDVRPTAELIAAIAQECVSSAFSVWAHRMVLEYVARGERSVRTNRLLDQLRSAQRVGATAMAAGLKSLAGLGEVDIIATRTGQGWSLTGPVAWASNLVAGSVFVAPARTLDGQSLVVWVDTDAPGVTVRPVSGLLALDSTASGSLKLENVAVADDQVLSTDLAGFARDFRPVFLVLQSAFCVGLIRRSLAEATTSLARGDNPALASDVHQLDLDVQRLLDTWEALAADVTSGTARELLQLRLDASHLAGRATRLEATLAGGRGYLRTSGTSRRFREAAFLPVQSPSEGHLRWELATLPA
ncbi:MAG: acyl-CoA dehydrogenase family protein [Propionibacteriaceae bacterium]|nr:acyl-CoA dehydrogenase family protein [Propionibacteriaceae bacterium]